MIVRLDGAPGPSWEGGAVILVERERERARGREREGGGDKLAYSTHTRTHARTRQWIMMIIKKN